MTHPLSFGRCCCVVVASVESKKFVYFTKKKTVSSIFKEVEDMCVWETISVKVRCWIFYFLYFFESESSNHTRFTHSFFSNRDTRRQLRRCRRHTWKCVKYQKSDLYVGILPPPSFLRVHCDSITQIARNFFTFSHVYEMMINCKQEQSECSGSDEKERKILFAYFFVSSRNVWLSHEEVKWVLILSNRARERRFSVCLKNCTITRFSLSSTYDTPFNLKLMKNQQLSGIQIESCKLTKISRLLQNLFSSTAMMWLFGAHSQFTEPLNSSEQRSDFAKEIFEFSQCEPKSDEQTKKKHSESTTLI